MFMKNEEKKAVGSLLAQKVLKTEVISSEEESAFCVGFAFSYTTSYYAYNKMEFF